MKRDVIAYSVFILATVLVAFILIQSNKLSDEQLFGLAINNSDVSFCAKIKPDTMVNADETETKVNIQGMAVLKDVCYSEFAEPVDDKINYCENVSDTLVYVCEPNGECYDMAANEACYRELFKDYISNAMPPQEGEITNLRTCQQLSMFRDNCLYLYAITTGDNSSCDLFDNRCPLRRQLCIDEAKKVNAPPLDLGDAVVYSGSG